MRHQSPLDREFGLLQWRSRLSSATCGFESDTCNPVVAQPLDRCPFGFLLSLFSHQQFQVAHLERLVLLLRFRQELLVQWQQYRSVVGSDLPRGSQEIASLTNFRLNLYGERLQFAFRLAVKRFETREFR